MIIKLLATIIFRDNFNALGNQFFLSLKKNCFLFLGVLFFQTKPKNNSER